MLSKPTFMDISMYEKAIRLVRDWKIIDKKIDQFMATVERGESRYPFDYYYDKESGSWFIITEMCNAGGCTLEEIKVESKEAAKRIVAQKTMFGEKMRTERACFACYSEIYFLQNEE
ncbi:hypothetical protein [Brevibacillus reuszeri]|uniref:hypothetical protein n=1 Tax=Brevibacillus reuszeri TaxID=54915 RepID=UPI000CCC33DD|nr:hypothetical protein [Brevibacillus reuszeri]